MSHVRSDEEAIQLLINVSHEDLNSLIRTNQQFYRISKYPTENRLYEGRVHKFFAPELIRFKPSTMSWKEFYMRAHDMKRVIKHMYSVHPYGVEHHVDEYYITQGKVIELQLLNSPIIQAYGEYCLSINAASADLLPHHYRESRLDMLKYLVSKGVDMTQLPFLESVIQYTAEVNTLDICNYVFSQIPRHLINNTLMTFALFYCKKYDTVFNLLKTYVEPVADAKRICIEGNNFVAMRWLENNYFEQQLNEDDLDYACMVGSLGIIQYGVSKDIYPTDRGFLNAARNGDLENFIFLAGLGYQITTEVYNIADRYENDQITDWINTLEDLVEN